MVREISLKKEMANYEDENSSESRIIRDAALELTMMRDWVGNNSESTSDDLPMNAGKRGQDLITGSEESIEGNISWKIIDSKFT